MDFPITKEDFPQRVCEMCVVCLSSHPGINTFEYPKKTIKKGQQNAYIQNWSSRLLFAIVRKESYKISRGYTTNSFGSV